MTKLKPFHLPNLLVWIWLLTSLAEVSAVGRGLRSQSQQSSSPNEADNGPSPAQLEEQEEDQEVPQEQDLPQLRGQQSGIIGASQSQNSPMLPAERSPQRLPAPEAKVDLGYSINNAASETLFEEPEPLSEESDSDNFPVTSSQEHNADLGLLAQSADTAPQPSVTQVVHNLQERPQQAATRPSSITAPGMLKGDAKPLFPLPAAAAKPKALHFTKTGAFQAEPKGPFNVVLPQKECNPPCIKSRGVCNDDVCFCKTPYTGTTCQHKMNSWLRVSYALVAAAAVVALFMGGLIAQIVHTIVNGHFEKRLSWLGDGVVNKELWAPPEKAKKGAPKA